MKTRILTVTTLCAVALAHNPACGEDMSAARGGPIPEANVHGKKLIRWGSEIWAKTSSEKCWQSQGFRMSGNAFLGVEFEVPADLDVESQDYFLAVGAYGADPVNIFMNGSWIGYFPKHRLPKATEHIKPGQTNLVGLNFLSKTGAGGLAGDVKNPVTPARRVTCMNRSERPPTRNHYELALTLTGVASSD